MTRRPSCRAAPSPRRPSPNGRPSAATGPCPRSSSGPCGSGRVTDAQQQAATAALASLMRHRGGQRPPLPVLRSDDGLALQGVVQLRPDLGRDVGDSVGRIRDTASRVGGTTAHVAGPAASQTDLGEAFAGIDGLLLFTALGVVLAILLLVYRALLLPLVIIVGSVFSLGLACGVVYVLADHGVVRVDGQVQGILSILVIGAATDYALLLAARFREELAARGDRFAAMRAALRRSMRRDRGERGHRGPRSARAAGQRPHQQSRPRPGRRRRDRLRRREQPDLPARRAAAARPGRLLARQAAGAASGGEGVWRRIAALVDRAPRRVWAASLALLLGCAAFSPR